MKRLTSQDIIILRHDDPLPANLPAGESLSSFNVKDLPKLTAADYRLIETSETSDGNDDLGNSSCHSCLSLASSVSVEDDDDLKYSNHSSKSKSVTFNETVNFRNIPSHSEMTKKEKAEIWSSKTELRSIKRRARLLIESFENGDDHCDLYEDDILSLEYHFGHEHQERGWRREESADAVFLLQEMQEDFWILFDAQGDISEMIGRRYGDLCVESRELALSKAARCAKEVKGDDDR